MMRLLNVVVSSNLRNAYGFTAKFNYSYLCAQYHTNMLELSINKSSIRKPDFSIHMVKPNNPLIVSIYKSVVKQNVNK